MPHSAAHFEQLSYRKDIDGLRGIAISFVLLFHLNVRFMVGGFVGVDVFFVISGFLISSIIFNHLERGDFSWSMFYRRRIRRLFPALFALYLATSIAACVILFPQQLLTYGQSLAAAALFCANFFFLRSGGYFEPSADLAPLQHMWSLAVEEQFYLIFPALALGLFKYFARRQARVYWIIALLSLAISIWLARTDVDAAFYMIPSRFWELLLGSLIALRAVPELTTRTQREIAGGFGLAVVILSGILISKKMPFPAETALIPCLGVGLLIHSGRLGDTIAARLLSARWLVATGLISYSLYLWHYPIISFYKWMTLADRLQGLDWLVIVPLSVAAAILSYRYVERPLRYSHKNLSNAKVFACAGAGLGILMAIAGVFIGTRGLEIRFSPEVLKYAEFKGKLGSEDCFIVEGRVTLAPSCLESVAGKRNLLLFGDSHAADLKTGFERAMPELHFYAITAAGCAPTTQKRLQQRCRTQMKIAFEDFLPKQKVDGIVLSANWTFTDIGYLAETVQRLKAYSDKIIVIGPAPAYRSALPLLLAEATRRGDPDFVQRNQIAERFAIDEAMRQALLPTGAHFISLTDALCSEQKCLRLDDAGEPIQFDYGHFTVPGAESAGRRIGTRMMSAVGD